MTQLTKEMKLKKWGPGPWVDEPDHVEWRHNGMPCIMHRQPSSGHWCGYVGVEPGHPWHGEYSAVQVDDDDDCWGTAAEREATVHGGVTYERACDIKSGVCHVAQPGEPEDVTWIGFDCAHSGDYTPNNYPRWPMRGYETYKAAGYVKAETERLADQAIARRSGPLPVEE